MQSCHRPTLYYESDELRHQNGGKLLLVLAIILVEKGVDGDAGILRAPEGYDAKRRGQVEQSEGSKEGSLGMKGKKGGRADLLPRLNLKYAQPREVRVNEADVPPPLRKRTH